VAEATAPGATVASRRHWVPYRGGRASAGSRSAAGRRPTSRTGWSRRV